MQRHRLSTATPTPTPTPTLALALALLLALPGSSRIMAGLDPEPRPFPEPAPVADDRSESYRAGQLALDDERWSDAARSFEQAADQGGPDADGALYWYAYSMLKLNRSARAMAALEELKRDYPQSSWVDDAVALEIEAGAPEAETAEGVDEDEELKLLALNTLIHVDWERAKPILERYLREDSSPRLKQRALFVISQSDSPEAYEMLIEAARGPATPEQARDAIHYLGYFDDARAAEVRRDIYASDAPTEVKQAVLEAMMMADDVDALAEVARNETNLELRRTAIELIGALDAGSLLADLYDRERSLEIKRILLEGFVVSGDKEALLSAAREESDPELRGTAIELLGVLDAAPELRQLYRAEPSPELRRKMAEGFMIAEDAEMLIEIARSDDDPGVRRAALEGLAIVESPAAKQALREIYSSATEVEVKRWIIDAFMIQEDSAKLIEIARGESNPALRRAAIEALSYLDDPAATEFMVEILEQDSF